MKVLHRRELSVQFVLFHPVDDLVDQGILEIQGVLGGILQLEVLHVKDGKRIFVFDLLGYQLLVPKQFLILLFRDDVLQGKIDDGTRDNKDENRVQDKSTPCFLK